MAMASKSSHKKDAGAIDEVVPAADRSECPPDEKIRALAKGELSGDRTLQQHVKECEWCAREYRDHAKDLEWNRFIDRSTKASYVVILAIIIFEVIRHLSKR